MQAELHTVIKTADLTIDPNTQQVFKNQRLVELPDLSYKTLLALIKVTPEVVSADTLIDQVWQDVAVSNETVTQRIALLRKSLAVGDTKKINYIQSIRNKGYRWVPAVESKTKANNKRKTGWVLFATVLTGLLVVLIVELLKPNSESIAITPNLTPTSSQASAADFSQQAWRYLEKHEAKSTALAIDLFRKSLALDSEQLNALTGLSFALSHQVTKFNQDSTLLVEAKLAAEQAIALDSGYTQGWAALGFVYDAMGELDEAVSYYEQALTFSPSDDSTASSLAYLYALQGRLVDALRLNISALGSRQLYLDLQIAQVLSFLGFDAVAEQWFAKADELSPDNVFATHIRARYYLSRNQLQQAEQVISAAIERGVNRPELPVLNGILAWIKNDSADFTDARAFFNEATSVDNGDIEAQLWLFLSQHSVNTSESTKQAFIDQWFAPPYSWPDAWVNQALFYAHFDDHVKAMDNLQQAYDSGFRNHRWLLQLPPFKVLHTDATWLRLIEAMQDDVSKQRQAVIQADWLPTSFLDPQN